MSRRFGILWIRREYLISIFIKICYPSYTHDLSGEILSTTYPSGITIECERDSLARIENIIMIDLDGTRTDILSDARYRPYGGVTQAVYGDGNVLDITYAPSGQIVSDRRNGVETTMILNARGRMASCPS